MIFDTDVLIWCFRGNVRAAQIVRESPRRELSIISLMELQQLAKSKHEQKLIGQFLQDHHFDLLPLSENIGHRASIYLEEYCLKAGLQMADALIAATAIENRKCLCSGNVKHYRVISEIDLKPFDPR